MDLKTIDLLIKEAETRREICSAMSRDAKKLKYYNDAYLYLKSSFRYLRIINRLEKSREKYLTPKKNKMENTKIKPDDLILGILMAYGLNGLDLTNASNELSKFTNDQTTQLREENERLSKLTKLLFSIVKENSMYIMAGQPDHEEQLKFVNSLNAIQKESEQLLKETNKTV